MLQTSAADTVQSVATPGAGLTGLFATYPLLETAVWIAGILFVAWLADVLTRRYILRVISRIVTQT